MQLCLKNWLAEVVVKKAWVSMRPHLQKAEGVLGFTSFSLI